MFFNKLFSVVPSLIKKFRRWDPAIAVIVLTVISGLSFAGEWKQMTYDMAPQCVKDIFLSGCYKDTIVVDTSLNHGNLFNSIKSIRIMDISNYNTRRGYFLVMKAYNSNLEDSCSFARERKAFSNSPFEYEYPYVLAQFFIISNGKIFAEKNGISGFDTSKWEDKHGGKFVWVQNSDSVCSVRLDTLLIFVRLNDQGKGLDGFYLDNIRCITTDGDTTIIDSCGESSVAAEEAKVKDLIQVSVFPNPSTSYFQINASKNFKGEIIDISGRTIKKVTTHWDGKDEKGQQMPNGIYFLKFRTGQTTTQKKIILLK
ncbi:MAG: T9SS type A sorting domain-containing protein [Patescibacteria group bacterium]|nr:T9SS type A sorting domain-containing protein [Patescibacteria group bacterium]